MYIFNNILFWVHLTALSMGGAATFGMPFVGMQLRTATPATAPVLFKVGHGLSTVSRAGLALLIITGPLLVWLKFGGTAGFNFWFWIKMVGVLLLLIDVIVAGILFKRAEHGDRQAGAMLPRVGGLGLVLLLIVVFCAVFTFN